MRSTIAGISASVAERMGIVCWDKELSLHNTVETTTNRQRRSRRTVHLLPLRFAAGEQAEGRKDDESTQGTYPNDVPPARVGDQCWDERVGQGEPNGEQTQSDPCDATHCEHGKEQWQRQNTGLGKERTIVEVQHTHVKKWKEKGHRPHKEQACSDDIIGNTREILRLAQE